MSGLEIVAGAGAAALAGLATAAIASRIAWTRALRRGDYPGPTELRSAAAEGGERPEWLLIHGASADARIWHDLLAASPDRPLAAATLGSHHRGPLAADPGRASVLDLCAAIERHAPTCGVVGHSTAALWLAEAARLRPDLLAGLEIILLAPNFGANVPKIGSLATRALLAFLRYCLPDPALDPFRSGACSGGTDEHYAATFRMCMRGRRHVFRSATYYDRLTGYSSSVEHEVAPFLDGAAARVRVYLAEHDQVVSHPATVRICEPRRVPVCVIPAVSHTGILLEHARWLPVNHAPQQVSTVNMGAER